MTTSDARLGACKICGRVYRIDEDGNLVNHTRFTGELQIAPDPHGRCIGSGKPPWDYRDQ